MPSITALTAADLDFGKSLTERLVRSQFPFQAVFWLFDEAADDWQLNVVTELRDTEGPRQTYLGLAEIASQLPGSGFHLTRISALSPKDPVYAALRSVFGPASNVEGARLHHTVVNGLLIPAAHLYVIR